MSTTYKVRAGDTFETVSRRVYGTERYSATIAKANPGTVEPLTPGSILAVPPSPTTSRQFNQTAPSDNPSEVAVLIEGQRFRFWSDLVLSRSIDAMDTLEFSAPFDVEAPGFRETFRPFSYKALQVTVGGSPLFSGTMVGVDPELDSARKTLSISGYSYPGVLNDCTAPASAFPLEFDNMDLEAIAAAMCEPFGVTPVFTAEAGAAFERVAAEPSDKVLDFLSDLARQQSLIVSSTPNGELLFQKSVSTGAPVAVLSQGVSPVTTVRPSFSPQQYYSHITGIESVIVGTEGSQHTVKNPHLAGAVRPLTFKAPDVTGGDLPAAVAAKAGRMYGNMASYSIAVDTWRDQAGNLWAPNTLISLEAPDAMVYSAYIFVVRSVQFSRTDNNESAQLDLVLPGSFEGVVPEVLPWEG